MTSTYHSGILATHLTRYYPMTTRAITILVKSAYGRLCYYPQCDDAKAFAAIAGNKTLTEASLKHIVSLGYTLHQVSPKLDPIPVYRDRS